MHIIRRVLVCLASLVLLASACSDDPAAQVEAAAVAEPTSPPAAEPLDDATPTPGAAIADGLGYSWTSPDPFDATFGDGSTVQELVQRLPRPTDLPERWQQVDLASDDENAACVGDEPDAAVEASWFVQPLDPDAVLPHVVILNIEQHGTSERAEQAARALGSDPWIECQKSVLTGDAENGVEMSSDNPAGEAYASPVDRAGIAARRQLVDAVAFGTQFALVGDTHVWTEGSTLFALSVMASAEMNDQLAVQASEILGDAPASAPETTQAVFDDIVPALRASIEHDPEALPFFERNARAQFFVAVPDEAQDCATAGEVTPLLILNGPIWVTPTGASLLIQGGLAFEDLNDAVNEFNRYEVIAESCLLERSEPLLGDSSVVGSASERITVDGVEVLLVSADLLQLASNDFVAQDIDVVAQQTMAISGNNLIGFEFLGIAGDEPDLVALTAAAVKRMNAS